MVLCAVQYGGSLEITPILSFRLSTYWAALDLAWILICNQYLASCKHLPVAVSILLGMELHLVRRCWMWNHWGESLWIQLKKKKKSLSLIVCFDLYVFAGTIVGCKPIFSTQIWDIYVYSYLPCCSRAAAKGRAQFIISVSYSRCETGDTAQWVFIPLIFAASDILLLQHQLRASFSTLLSSL